jgi:hypothetical protein
MEILGQMAGGLAHDFRNMLTVISGYTRLIEKISKDDKIISFANNIDIATERASALTKNLLTFSRGETVRNEPFTANDTINEVVKLLPPVLGRVCAFELDMPDRKFTVKGDPGKLNQCLLNLCINARDAMKEKGGENKLTMRVREEEARWLCIDIIDTGTGVPPHIIGRIFDPFFSTKKKGEGTGLGLSVVYGIAKAHGGSITLDSRPGEGATFTLKLPLEAAPVAKGRSVFVVDSDSMVRGFCSDILAHLNYTPVPFETLNDLSGWLQNQGTRTTPIGLVSARHYDNDTRELLGRIPVIWMYRTGEPVPEETLVLRQPFPPAALLNALKTAEQKLTAAFK